MKPDHKLINETIGPGGSYGAQDEDEIELTFQLQNIEAGNSALLLLLVDRYALEVTRLAKAILSSPSSEKSEDTVVKTVVRNAFIYAILHNHRFKGEQSLRNWLFKITIYQATRHRSSWWRWFLRCQGWKKNELKALATNPGSWQRFDCLPYQQRLALILVYLCKLRLEDLADVLHVRLDRAHRLLVKARQTLCKIEPEVHHSERVEAYHDGLLVKNPSTRSEVESHLLVCKSCDSYLTKLRSLDQQLQEDLQKRWTPTTLTDVEIEKLTQPVGTTLPKRHAGDLLPVMVGKITWIAGLFILFFGSVAYLISHQPEEPEFAPRPTLTATAQVPVTEPQKSVQDSAIENQSSGLLKSMSLYTYDLSAGAETLVFMSTASSQQGDNIIQQVYLYDRKNLDLLVHEQHQDEASAVNWLNSPPSLSADGRYLAYSLADSTSPDLSGACRLTDGQPCTDIFVYDQVSGEIQQITHGLFGLPANDISFAPRLSADGRWVAFWSLASNLSADDTGPCSNSDQIRHPCMDIFLVDRRDKTIFRIPVGRNPSSGLVGPDRISLSADGQLVGFTVSAQDQLAGKLNLQHESQAVLYDRQSGEYQLINRAMDGDPGNARSFGPVISADGHYIAFSSLASNLVPGDTNQALDVFLLDLKVGDIERVSLSPQGEQGNGDSGVLLEGMGFHSLDVSADGRYVVFLTLATNFGSQSDCEVGEAACNQVMLYDRLRGSSAIIQPMQNFHLYLYPRVSNDGRWVSYLDIRMDCEILQGLCMEMVLYDRERNWESQMIQKLFHPIQLGWQEASPIQGMEQEVELLTVAQRGDYMAASYPDKSIAIWDFLQEKWIGRLSSSSKRALTSLAFSPDGRILAAGTEDGLVQIWGITENRILYRLENHPGRVHTVVFTADGHGLLVGTPNEVWVWREEDGKFIRVNQYIYPIKTNSLAISPNDNLLAVATSDQTVWLQLLPSGRVISRLGGQTATVMDVTFSPDGRRLATRSTLGEVNLWDINWSGYGALQTEFYGMESFPNLFGNLAFSPGGEVLISGSMNQGVVLWDLNNHVATRLSSTEHGDGIIKTIAFSPDGSAILAGIFGAIDTWSRGQFVRDAQYFHPVTKDVYTALAEAGIPLAGDWPEMQPRLGDSTDHLDLYLADELLPYNLLVPTHLPEQISFYEAQLLQDEGVLLHYKVKGLLDSHADLYILEYPRGSVSRSMTVGENVLVEVIGVGQIDAEYVAGDWGLSATDTLMEDWSWDETQPVQRLRWQTGSLMVSIFYQEYPKMTSPRFGLTLVSPTPSADDKSAFSLNKQDLAQIARGMNVLPDLLPVDRLEVNYTIQAGDTCSGIADEFSLSIESLTQYFGLSAGCDLIYAGDVVTLPFTAPRLNLVDQGDMDCDGRVDYLQGLPASKDPHHPQLYALFIREMTDLGFLHDAWGISAAAEGVDYFMDPTLFEFGSCQGFLAYQILDGTNESLRVAHWKDDQMEFVLEKGIRIIAMDPSVQRLIVLEKSDDPLRGTCFRWHVTYQWDGKAFVEVDRQPDPIGGC